MVIKAKIKIPVGNIKNKFQYMDFIILLLSVYAFFGYLLPKNASYIMLAGILIGIFMYILVNDRRITYNNGLISVLIITFILINLSPALYSRFPDTSIKTSINRSTILAIGALLCVQGYFFQKGVKYLFYASVIHSVFTLFSYLLPNIFVNKILVFLPSEVSIESIRFLSKNLYAGITNQIGRNSFYLSIGIAILYCHLLVFRKDTMLIKKIILIMLGLTLLLTGKRGSLVTTVFSALFIVAVDAKFKGSSGTLKIIRNLIIITVFIVIIIYAFPEAAAPFTRFLDRIGGDITSGRAGLYKNALEMFKEKPLLGWGSGVFSSFYGTGVHSLYIQLLAENGLIGFVNFMVIIVVNVVITFKVLKVIYYSKKYYYLEYLLFSLYIQIFFVLYGFVGNPLNDGFVLIMYFIASSIPYTLSKNAKNQHKNIA